MLTENVFQDTKKLMKWVAYYLLMLVLFGCGKSSSTSSTAKTGVFIDSPVQGLTYKTETLSGVTGPNGDFKYHTGETVVFSIGDVVIGSAVGDSIITPLHLGPKYSYSDTTGINISRLLQSLDVDDNLDNGIQITPEIRDKMKGRVISFAKPVSEFEDDNLKSLFVTLNNSGVFNINGQRRIKTELEARLHLFQSLKNISHPPTLPRYSSIHTQAPIFHSISTSFHTSPIFHPITSLRVYPQPRPFPIITSIRVYPQPRPFSRITSVRVFPQPQTFPSIASVRVNSPPGPSQTISTTSSY